MLAAWLKHCLGTWVDPLGRHGRVRTREGGRACCIEGRVWWDRDGSLGIQEAFWWV